MKKVLPIAVVVGVVIIAVLIFFIPTVPEGPRELCIQACQDALARGIDLSAGPCLLDPMEEYADWVCDVAHSPRIPEDNLPENQCSAWREGRATHFVEVTPTCDFIVAR